MTSRDLTLILGGFCTRQRGRARADLAGRLVGEMISIIERDGREVFQVFDAKGVLQSETSRPYPDDSIVRVTYYAGGQLATVIEHHENATHDLAAHAGHALIHVAALIRSGHFPVADLGDAFRDFMDEVMEKLGVA